MNRPYDKELQDADRNQLRVYNTTDERVRIISDVLTKELVFDRSSAVQFITAMLEALGIEIKD